nr:MAG TPA: hypothetical protein [Caudoviricetes sp.]
MPKRKNASPIQLKRVAYVVKLKSLGVEELRRYLYVFNL